MDLNEWPGHMQSLATAVVRASNSWDKVRLSLCIVWLNTLRTLRTSNMKYVR
jgi:hypothetical protein